MFLQSQVRRESHDVLESMRSDHLKGQDDERRKSRAYEQTIQDLQKQVSESEEREKDLGKSVSVLMSLFERNTPLFQSVEATFEKIEERIAGFDLRIENMSSDVLVLKSANRERRLAVSSKEMAIQNLTKVRMSHVVSSAPVQCGMNESSINSLPPKYAISSHRTSSSPRMKRLLQQPSWRKRTR